jgi:hypothetical protein
MRRGEKPFEEDLASSPFLGCQGTGLLLPSHDPSQAFEQQESLLGGVVEPRRERHAFSPGRTLHLTGHVVIEGHGALGHGHEPTVVPLVLPTSAETKLIHRRKHTDLATPGALQCTLLSGWTQLMMRRRPMTTASMPVSRSTSHGAGWHADATNASLY